MSRISGRPRGASGLAGCVAWMALGLGSSALVAAPAKSGGGVALLPGASSKEPVNIDANKLDYFDKEQKLIYTGDVVAVQGETTMKASVLTILLQKDAATQPGAPAPAPAPAGGPGVGPASGTSVKHMDADGPVTLISKDQIGTGDHATYDKAENRVTLIGNVTLSQGSNVTQGDKLIYDLNTAQAQVFSGHTNDRVRSVFTPGAATPGGDPASAEEGKAPKKDKAAAAKRKTPPRKAAATTDGTANQ